MSVYVDDMRAPFRGMIMCHMWGDTLNELHDMAAKLGLRRAWFQCPPRASWEHYDISLNKRHLAVRLGAIETNRYGPVEHLARLAGDMAKLAQIARLRERR